MQSSLIGALAVFLVPPADAASALEQGFAGAIRGCEEWVLNPESWIIGPAPFIAAVGLGDMMSLVSRVDEASIPPAQLRLASYYWRINSTADAGFVLVVSDQLPMCHITGGGGVDLQPVVEAVLTSTEITNRWEAVESSGTGDMSSTVLRNRTDPSLTAVISRANAPGARLDRVQVLVTATYGTKRGA